MVNGKPGADPSSLLRLERTRKTGLATSTFYYLFAVAFALVLKVNRVWNFGQAGIMVFAYFSMYVALQWWALPQLAGIGFAIVVTIAVSLALEWFGFGVFRNRRSSVLAYFIFTIAISQCAVYLGEMIFGADPKTLYAYVMSPVFDGSNRNQLLGSARACRDHITCNGPCRVPALYKGWPIPVCGGR